MGSTIYTVVGAIGNCTDTKTVSLSVNPLPIVSASASPTVICAGNSTTLTAIGATTYTWFPGSFTGAAVIVTPPSNTTYTVVGSNGTCTNQAVVSVSVNGTPTLIATANPTSYCAGSGGTSTLTGSGALTYTWNPGAITGNTVVVSPTVTTIYTVTGANGSCTNTNTISLTVNPRPTITATANPIGVCAGGSATLAASGGLTYTWSPGSVIGNPVVVTPGATTTYSVRADNIFGCTGGTTLILTVNPSPTVTASASPTVICSGGGTPHQLLLEVLMQAVILRHQ